jgi:hypothetical protein
MKPICVECRRFYRPFKNGVWFLEGRPKYNGAPTGLQAPDDWSPCKLWHGDVWMCHGCGHKLISGVGHAPLSEHYQPQFAGDVEACKPILQVNDC